MSKLGKIYVIDIFNRTKYVYPVVYMNKDYIYCKVHGSNYLERYDTPEYSSRTWYYDTFKEYYDAGKIKETVTHTIYVPAHVKTYFEWIKEKSITEILIENLQKEIRNYSSRIWEATDTIDRCTRQLEHNKTLRDTAIVELEELQRQLAEERSNV